MKQRILLLFALATVFGSCSVYKNGQTPDDVYYSPSKNMAGYVSTEEEKRPEETNPDDRYLRMKSQNRTRWSAFDDDMAYWNNPAWNNQMYFSGFRNPYYSGWNVGIGYTSGWNSYGYGWNPFYPGYYGSPIVVINSKPVNSRSYSARGTNLNNYYTSGSTYTTNPKTGERVYNISSSGSSTLRNYRSPGGSYYTPSSGSYRNSSGSPTRSFNNSSNPTRTTESGGSKNNSSGGTRSSGGSGGGSAPVRSFPRGGGK